jgi:hypothetical protein
MKVFNQEGSDLKWSKSDVLPKDFVENSVFLSKVSYCFPVPLGVYELAVVHVASQGLLSDAAERSSSAVVSGEDG